MQQEFLNLLQARKGHFKLESGLHGDIWMELDRWFLRPNQLQPFVLELARRLSQHHIDAVCGPLVGGAFIAQMIAIELKIEFYYAERFAPPQPDKLYAIEYRLPKEVRQDITGKSVAIVDDVVNAGSAVRGTYESLKAAGAVPKVIGALLVLSSTVPDYFAAYNIPAVLIAQQSSGLWQPDVCPLCAEQVPLEDVYNN